MMTSSVRDLSDENGPDEQQKQIQSEIQSQTPANGNFEPGTAVPSSEYTIPSNHLEMGHTMAHTAYPFMDPYYGGIIAAYGGQPAIHPHLMGVLQPGMPLPPVAVEEPVYVNAKQYHGILRRRQSRAKAESENKLIKARKPYLHESRHLHALKRARGCGGRFLNSKPESSQEEGDSSNDQSQSCNAQSSENLCVEDQQNAVTSRDGKAQGTKVSNSRKPCFDGESPPSAVTS